MWRSFARRVLLPCGTVALAVIIEALLQTRLHQLVLTPSLAAVVISVLYGGLTAGLVATFLSIVLMDVLLLSPGFSAQTAAIEDVLQLVIFLMVGLVVSSLSKEKMARIKAEARSKAKDDLLREVAHELRTPMTSILGWTEILRHRPDSENLHRACEVIERNAKMQMTLVDDLLDVARILTGRLILKKAPVDLRNLVAAAVRIVQPAATTKRIRIVLREPENDRQIMVEGDERRLLQVFWNLLTNAIKFTPEQGLVTVDTKVVEDSAVVDVIDNGLGIRAEQLPSIFEKGEQGGKAEISGGLGLGLWLAKSVTRMHEGDIEVSSTEGKGSTFSVRLPLIDCKEALAGHRELQAN